MYHNTIPIKGEPLAKAMDKVFTQDMIIMNLFERHKRFSPSQMYQREFAGRCPLTSIRRSFSDLTKAGKLRKTGVLVPGMYGQPENVWELIEPQLKLL